jgi:hypothetical protein
MTDIQKTVKTLKTGHKETRLPIWSEDGQLLLLKSTTPLRNSSQIWSLPKNEKILDLVGHSEFFISPKLNTIAFASETRFIVSPINEFLDIFRNDKEQLLSETKKALTPRIKLEKSDCWR